MHIMSNTIYEDIRYRSIRLLASSHICDYMAQIQQPKWMPVYRCWFSFSIFIVGKVCDKPIIKNVTTFPVFSGSGSSNYSNARFSASGWCASGSAPYLSIELQKEYHITRVVVMGNRDQTKWSGSYLMKYSHGKTHENSQKVFMKVLIEWIKKGSRFHSTI
jgi:hypothetical protein